jgi:molybdate transport system substrate-binding protein
MAQTPHPTGELSVFAAASLTEPFSEIGTRLQATYPGLQIVYNFGGSQLLRRNSAERVPMSSRLQMPCR